MASRTVFQLNDSFQCELQCQQCAYMKETGSRCKNRTCIGVPFCWQHNRRLYGVQVRSSNHGKGLFTTRFFPSGSWITPYKGEILSAQCLHSRYPGDITAPYSVRVNAQTFIDSACYRGIGSMANAKFGRNRFSRPRNFHNSELSKRRNGEIWLKAIRDIPADHEIYVYYGTDYLLQHNHTTRRSRNYVDTRPC